jgi:hypothetical protein
MFYYLLYPIRVVFSKYISFTKKIEDMCFDLMDNFRRWQLCRTLEKTHVYDRGNSKWRDPQIDPTELFYKAKMEEQQHILLSEVQQMRSKLKELNEYVVNINSLKKKFVNTNGKYYSVLNMWNDDLEVIFSKAQSLSVSSTHENKELNLHMLEAKWSYVSTSRVVNDF